MKSTGSEPIEGGSGSALCAAHALAMSNKPSDRQSAARWRAIERIGIDRCSEGVFFEARNEGRQSPFSRRLCRRAFFGDADCNRAEEAGRPRIDGPRFTRPARSLLFSLSGPASAEGRVAPAVWEHLRDVAWMARNKIFTRQRAWP